MARIKPSKEQANFFSQLCATIMSHKVCVWCRHHFTITKKNKGVCPKCKKR